MHEKTFYDVFHCRISEAPQSIFFTGLMAELILPLLYLKFYYFTVYPKPGKKRRVAVGLWQPVENIVTYYDMRQKWISL